jgi:alginate O-acetyltransferase complex protein AlgI
LGNWFKDYVYVPLGGNRSGKLKWIRNIAVVWLLTGIWHGAAWNFVVWGGLFGVLLGAEKVLGKHRLEKVPPVFRHIYVISISLISFVIFGSDGFTAMFARIGAMFGFGGHPVVSIESLYQMRSHFVLLAISIVGATPLPKSIYDRATRGQLGEKLLSVIEPVTLGALLVIVTSFLVDGSFNPFLYFRF